MQLSTLLEFTDKQLLTLSSRLLGEEDSKSDILKKQLEIQKRYEQDMANINQEKANTVDTNEGTTDPRFPEPKKYKDSEGKEMDVLEDDLEEGMFGDPDNAAYLDDPSFTNPDAEGFQSPGPEGGQAYDGYDMEEAIGFTEPKYSFSNPNEKGHQSDGPMGNSSGIHEDDIEEQSNMNALAGEKLSGQEVPHDADDMADDGMDDDSNPNSPSHKNDGDIAEAITKKELLEIAVSKKQYNFYNLVKSCKTSKYTKCGDGRNNDAVLKAAKSMTLTAIEDYTNTPNADELPTEKSESMDKNMVENWLLNLVEKYERPQMSKKDLITTIKEMKTMDVGLETVTDPDVEDAALELPSWLDFDSLFSADTPLTMPEPTTKPTTTPLKTPKKPGRKSPYQPKHKPKPKAYKK